MLKKWWNTGKEGLSVVAVYLGIAFVIWLVLVAVYGMGYTPVKESILYNTPEQETVACFVIAPIFSMLWGVWAWILVKIADLIYGTKEKA